MNAEVEQNEGGRPVDDRLDVLLAKLSSLSTQVDEVTESLTRADAEVVRRAFKAKEGGAGGQA